MLLVFDLDGTLVDSSPDVLVSMEFALRSTSLTPTRALDSTLIGPPLPAMIRTALPGASDADVERAVAAFRGHYDACGYTGTTLYPGVRELLLALEAMGARALIATNKPRQASVAILERLGVRHAFTDIVCIGDCAARNKTELVGELLQRHPPPANEGWMIGDAPSDIQAGRAHGLRTVAHLGGYTAPKALRAENPDIVIERMSELLPVLSTDPVQRLR